MCKTFIFKNKQNMYRYCFGWLRRSEPVYSSLGEVSVGFGFIQWRGKLEHDMFVISVAEGRARGTMHGIMNSAFGVISLLVSTHRHENSI
jgi:hypothetical protein